MTAGRTVNSESVCWCTPKHYLDSVRKVFGGYISLDPCSNQWSIVAAQTEYKLPTDGLKESWEYPTIFVNPPYGRCTESKTSIKHWINRCAEAANKGSAVIALIPVATNTSHWKDIVFKTANAVCFLGASRVKFLDKGQPSKKGAPMACAVVYWGSSTEMFSDEFQQHGFTFRLA